MTRFIFYIMITLSQPGLARPCKSPHEGASFAKIFRQQINKVDPELENNIHHFGEPEKNLVRQHPAQPPLFIVFPAFAHEMAGRIIGYPSLYESSYSKELEKLRRQNRRRYSGLLIGEVPLCNDKVGYLALLRPIIRGETLGKVNSWHQQHIIRIKNLLKAFPNLQRTDIYFVGFSYGSARALDLIATLNKAEDQAQLQRLIKGVISINGALWGSIADFSLVPDTPIQQITQNLQTITELNHSLGGWLTYGKTIGTLARQTYKLLKTHNKLPENINVPLPHIAKLARLVLEPYFFIPQHQNYPQQVMERVQNFIGLLDSGRLSLTSEERTNWFANHELPDKIRYLYINSQLDHGQVSSSLEDYISNLASTTLVNHKWLDTNDGWVSIKQSSFNPKRHQQLNPRQKPYKATFLARLATDHIAPITGSLTIDAEARRKDQLDQVLLKSLMIYVSQK